MSRGSGRGERLGERFRRDDPMSNDLLERRVLALERRMERVEFRVGLASPRAQHPAGAEMREDGVAVMRGDESDEDAVAAILEEPTAPSAAPAADESLAAHLRALREDAEAARAG